ncbi:MAG: cupin domain-containing protein [Candidatus Saccharimonadales bacterium]
MSGYTILNLKDLEDMAAKFGRTGYEARFATKPLGLEKSGLGYQKLQPNHRMDFGHTHDVQEEVFIVVNGSGRVKLDDEVRDLKTWDAVRVPKEVMRGFEAGPDGMELLIFGAPHTEKNDAQLERDWWTD